MTVKHLRWADIPVETITPSIARQFMSGDNVTIAIFALKKGGVVPRHAHQNEQVSCVLSGALKFSLDGQEMVVRGGETIQIPGNVEHEVEVLEEARVIDVFSPVRQDWIDGTDHYFKRKK